MVIESKFSKSGKMNQRKVLARAVASLFLLLLMAFFFVVFKGVAPVVSDFFYTPNDAANQTLFKGITQGQTVLRRYQGKTVWVTAIDEKIISGASTLNSYLFNQNQGCDVKKPFCVLNAATKQDGIYVSFTTKEPKQLPSSVPWLGGFVDPTSGELYDVLGRAYRVNQQKTVLSLPVITVD